MIYILVLLYVLLAVLTFGFHFAYYQRKYELIAKFHYKDNFRSSLFMAAFGPVGFLTLLTCHFFSGIKYFSFGVKFR